MDNPEAFLDALTIRSLKERYHGNGNHDASGVIMDAFPVCPANNEDLELFVRDFTIDDSISDCFADSDCDTPTVIGVNCKPSSKLTPSLSTAPVTSHHDESVISHESAATADHTTTSSTKRHNIVTSLFHRKHKKGDTSSVQSSSTLDKSSGVIHSSKNGHVHYLKDSPSEYYRSQNGVRNYCNCKNSINHDHQVTSTPKNSKKTTFAGVDVTRLDSTSCLKADEFYSEQKATKTKSAMWSNGVVVHEVSKNKSHRHGADDRKHLNENVLPDCKSDSNHKLSKSESGESNIKKEKRNKSNKSRFGLDWFLEKSVRRGKKSNKSSEKETCENKNSHSTDIDVLSSSSLEKHVVNNAESDTIYGLDFSAITDAAIDELFLIHARRKLKTTSPSKSEPRLRTRNRNTSRSVHTAAETDPRRKSDGFAHCQTVQNQAPVALPSCRHYPCCEIVRGISHPSKQHEHFTVQSDGKFPQNRLHDFTKPSPWYDADSDESIHVARSRDRKYRFPTRNGHTTALCDVIDHSAASEVTSRLSSKSSCSILKAKSRLSKSCDGFDKMTTWSLPMNRRQEPMKWRENFCDNPHCRSNFAINTFGGREKLSGASKSRPSLSHHASFGDVMSLERNYLGRVSGFNGLHNVQEQSIKSCNNLLANSNNASFASRSRVKYPHQESFSCINSHETVHPRTMSELENTYNIAKQADNSSKGVVGKVQLSCHGDAKDTNTTGRLVDSQTSSRLMMPGFDIAESKENPENRLKAGESLPENSNLFDISKLEILQHQASVSDAFTIDMGQVEEGVTSFSGTANKGSSISSHDKDDIGFHSGTSLPITADNSNDSNNNNIIIKSTINSSSSNICTYPPGCCCCCTHSANTELCHGVGDTATKHAKERNFHSSSAETVVDNSVTESSTPIQSCSKDDNMPHIDAPTSSPIIYAAIDKSPSSVQRHHERSEIIMSSSKSSSIKSEGLGSNHKSETHIGNDNDKDNDSFYEKNKAKMCQQDEQAALLEMVTTELCKRLILTEQHHERLAKTMTNFLTLFDGEDALHTICRALEQLQLLLGSNGTAVDGTRITAKSITELQNVVDVIIGIKSSLEDAQGLEGDLLSCMKIAEDESVDNPEVSTSARSFLQEILSLPRDERTEVHCLIQSFVSSILQSHHHQQQQPQKNQITSAVNPPKALRPENKPSKTSSPAVSPRASQNGAVSSPEDMKSKIPDRSSGFQEDSNSENQPVDEHCKHHSADNQFSSGKSFEVTRKRTRQRVIPEAGLTGFPDYFGESPSHERKRRATMSQFASSGMPQGLQREHIIDDWSYDRSGSDGECDYEDDYDDDEEDNSDDDSDYEKDYVKLIVENGDVAHEDLRHDRLQRHLRSVEKLRHTNDDLIETVVTGTGQTLTPFSQSNDAVHVSGSEAWPISTASLTTHAPTPDNTECVPNDISKEKVQETELARNQQKSGLSKAKKRFRFRFFGYEKNSEKDTYVSDDGETKL